MLSKDRIDKLAADYAKEIVVAKMSNSDFTPTQSAGKTIAEFYGEIFKGISETLKNSDISYGN